LLSKQFRILIYLNIVTGIGTIILSARLIA
jgi:hypothetical protein